jgi:glycosyltransferase involved in cell wall biosynthesis
MESPTISVVVSCYKKHLVKLMRLLDSIAQQTVHPLEVIVSSSSCEPSDVPVLAEYPFPVTLILHKVRKNAAENRNIAIKLARGDIVSFFDADDIMLPRRLEAIRTAFVQGARFAVHNFTEDLGATDAESGSEIIIEHGVLQRAPSLCIIHMRDFRIPLHHSQSSVARDILKTIQFHEEASYERREDAVFCGDVVITGCPTAYIGNKLAIYDMAGSW